MNKLIFVDDILWNKFKKICRVRDLKMRHEVERMVEEFIEENKEILNIKGLI